ncbi:monovalent cation:proton antiporter family protein [Candidatus Sulfidibacterium hydrothermale]|uniref:monovalent cation:proton antiporter family protein n=1 Tax=Candidatus Sulfidibacterium hydrothermale TaxID=2875962 RepID=UPI001F0AEB6D|nr:monovalent cation:proton antiporter family protein [Candidatus Sulfidibacterium hydrothermale]UBM62023.1 monovalent cation:proton antiporter family protein [Candidatus Sulfidibacterium hydrothermale]
MLLSLSFHFDYYPLLLVAGVAWLVPILLSLLRLNKIPAVIVEIILGYFLGHYILVDHFTESFHILEFLALSGFVFLMFLGGLEIDVDQIRASFPRRRFRLSLFTSNPLLSGVLHFILAIILGYLATLVLAQLVEIPHTWYFALIMGTTSVGIVLPVLKSRGELSSRFGQMIIIAAALADILSILLFTFTAFIIKNGFRWELLYILVLFFVFFVFYRLGNHLKRLTPLKKLAFQLSHAASQIRVRGTILMILIFVVMSQYISEEVVLLGAFLSGLILSTLLHKERSVLMIKLDGMGYGFFIPIFFIMVGMQFDPSSLKEFDHSVYGFLILLLFTLFFIKIVPSLLWAKVFGFQKALSAGFLMSSRLSLIIAASAVGLQLGVITPGINAGFILMAVITCLLSPVIFNSLNPVRLTEGEKVIIVGGSSTGVLLARRMNIHGKKVVLVEKNKNRFDEIKSKGLWVIQADGAMPETYKKLKLAPENYVVVETGNDQQNFEIVRFLRNELQHERIIMRACKMPCVEKLNRLGIDTVDLHRVLATAIENLILRPTTYHDLVETFENYSVEEIIVTRSDLNAKKVKEIPFHSGAILMMITRDYSSFIPHGETYLQTGDRLHIFGTPTALEAVRRQVQR